MATAVGAAFEATAVGVLVPLPGALPLTRMPRRWVAVASKVRSPRSAFFKRPFDESTRVAARSLTSLGSR